MKTDELIRALAQDGPAGPGPVRLAAWSLVPATLITLAGLLAILGARPDFVAALTTWSVWRYLTALALFAAAFAALSATARPDGRSRSWPLLLVAGLALGLLLWAWIVTPAESRSMALWGKTRLLCLIAIPVLSILPVAALMASMRRGASIRPALSGAFAGLAGSAVGTFIYSIYCTEDTPLFWVIWFGLAILGVTLVSAFIGSRVLRW